jgi:hypothetical protein
MPDQSELSYTISVCITDLTKPDPFILSNAAELVRLSSRRVARGGARWMYPHRNRNILLAFGHTRLRFASPPAVLPPSWVCGYTHMVSSMTSNHFVDGQLCKNKIHGSLLQYIRRLKFSRSDTYEALCYVRQPEFRQCVGSLDSCYLLQHPQLTCVFGS